RWRGRWASSCGCDHLSAAQRRRRRRMDLDADEVSRLRSACEVDGRVPSRPAAQEIVVGPTRTLDENLLDTPDPLAIPFTSHRLDDLYELLDACLLDLVRHPVRHGGRLGAAPR